MNIKRSTLLVLSALTLLGACASKVPLDNAPANVETRTPVASSGDSASSAGAGANNVAKVDLTQQQSNASDSALAANLRIVYFDYDSFVVKDDYRSVIEANARLLTSNRGRKLTIEGHTDERGGSEYNLALGQKRAESVAKALMLLGATESQIESVSFGKERPAVQGSDESAWAKNRRAELKPR